MEVGPREGFSLFGFKVEKVRFLRVHRNERGKGWYRKKKRDQLEQHPWIGKRGCDPVARGRPVPLQEKGRRGLWPQPLKGSRSGGGDPGVICWRHLFSHEIGRIPPVQSGEPERAGK